jgi:ABC-type Fe3+ transport system permease subunit
MEKHQKRILWAVLISETSHIFCCVLPIVFSILSLLTGAGFLSAMPPGLVWFHDLMHRYELPMILISGVILGLGWLILWQAKRNDCHSHGCVHEPCGPKKNLSRLILIFATVLFVVNVSVYTLFHSSVAVVPIETGAHFDGDGHAH